jgi:uncharacterized protein YbbC (DUF1343 family)
MLDNQASPHVFRYRLLLIAAIFFASGTMPWLRSEGQSGTSIHHARTGIDVLEGEHFAPLRGKRVGLITNQTGVDSKGRRTIDVLAHAEGVKLIAIFSPEHGIAGKVEDTGVTNATDPATGLPIYSLYGETRRPTPEMLANLDALVFDMQDAGVRFYTYITTMGYAMEEAAKHHIAFFVLDRPNPLGGEVIEGPVLDRDRLSFVGYFTLPVRYAMTLGELAQMFNAENKIGAELHVISMRDWSRRDTFEMTGVTWIPPSPNLRTANAAFLYPGIEILQAGGVSVGRGTDTPFELFGAPWMVAADVAAELNRRAVPGARFSTALFTPGEGLYKDQYCQGVSIAITDRASFRPSFQSMRMGIEIADVLHRMYPRQFQLEKNMFLLGSQTTLDRLERGDTPKDIVDGWAPELDKFRAMRQKYLLYH